MRNDVEAVHFTSGGTFILSSSTQQNSCVIAREGRPREDQPGIVQERKQEGANWETGESTWMCVCVCGGPFPTSSRVLWHTHRERFPVLAPFSLYFFSFRAVTAETRIPEPVLALSTRICALSLLRLHTLEGRERRRRKKRSRVPCRSFLSHLSFLIQTTFQTLTKKSHNFRSEKSSLFSLRFFLTLVP